MASLERAAVRCNLLTVGDLREFGPNGGSGAAPSPAVPPV